MFENAATSGSVPTSSTSIPPRTSISMIWITVARNAMIPSTIAMNAVVTVPASPTVNPAGAPAAWLRAGGREAEQVREMIGEVCCSRSPG